MARIAAIVVLEDLEDRDSLMSWAEERELPLAFITDQRFIADIADSLPTDPSRNTLVEFE